MFKMYWNIEEKCRRFTKRMCIYVPLNQIMMIVSLFASFYNIFTGNLDTSTWNIPCNMVVPFNTKIIWKWYVLLAFQSSISFCYASITSGLTAYFTCCCFYIIAVCDHCDMLIASLQSHVDQNKSYRNPQGETLQSD